MKKLYIYLFSIICCFLANHVMAQNDVLLSEDFQEADDADYAVFPDPPLTDSMWISYDEDQIGDGSGADRPGNLYLALDFEQQTFDSIPPADTNVVIAGSSWLAGFDTSSSNWLITPAIYIGDDQATLHWKSAPFQGPRYMDGYSVKILDGSSIPDAADAVDMVFRAAEMTAITGESASVDQSNFEFGPGYFHASGLTDTTYFVPVDTADANPAHTGILEPHSVSLADYAEKWIFIAFHHDSADDNLIAFDDIEVLGNLVSSTKTKVNDLRFVTYPNPVANYLNVMFRTQAAADLGLELFNSSGQKVAEIPLSENVIGEFNERFDMRNLPTGSYSVVLTVDGEIHTKNIIRN